MTRSRYVAAIVPAALVLSLAAFAQQDRPRQSQRDQSENRQRQSQRELSESGLTLQGPNGESALQVRKSAPQEVRAGEQFEYQITVRNVSDSPLQKVVVVEEVQGLEVRDAQAANQQGRQGQGQRQRGQRNREGQQGQSQQGQSQQGQNQDQQAQNQSQRNQRRQGQNQQAQNRQGQNQDQQAQNQRRQNRQQRQQQQAQNGQQQGQQNQQGQVQQEGNQIRYEIGRLDAGQSRTLTVSAVANESGQAHSCMYVDFQPTICSTIDVVQPDFRLVGRLLFERGIETEGDIEGIYSCDDLRLELAVTSTGDAATPPAQATVNLPEGLTTQDGEKQIQLDMGRLEPNQTARKEIPLKLDPQQASDELEIQASAEAGDLQAEIQLPGVKVLDPQLEVSINAPEQAYIDRPVEANITVENTGDDPALNTVVRIEGLQSADQINVRGANGERAGRDGTINIGRLEGGESREFTVQMQARQPTEATVAAVAEAYCAGDEDAARDQAQIAFRGIPAVLIEVVDKTDPVQVGQTTSYEIAVKNQGSEKDTGIELSATLPDSMEFVRGDGETEVQADGKNISFGQLQELAPGDIVSWTLQVKANRADKARLKVELKSDATDEPITEEEPTTLFGDSPQGGQQGQSANQNQSGNQNQQNRNRTGNQNQSGNQDDN